jgi:thiamine-monophosphate kinase
MTTDKVDSEEAIIAAFWAPLAEGFPGAFGLKDDCAALSPPPGCDLVLTTDSIVAGVHVLPDETPDAIAWKALAVNVSDLIAKGASPLAYLMSLGLPEAPEREWLAAFANGLARAQAAFGCRLIGGDTDRVPGPLSVSITALGTIPRGSFVQRATARAGDLVYVSGTIGDAALGLALRRDPSLGARWKLDAAGRKQLESRFRMPSPPVALAGVVRTFARAAMDISDGLVKDFDRLCRTAHVGGRLEAARVPLSAPASTVVGNKCVALEALLTGGEDYEVLAVVAPERAAEFERAAAASGHSVTRIGAIDDVVESVSVLDPQGIAMAFATSGWDHFRPRAAAD